LNTKCDKKRNLNKINGKNIETRNELDNYLAYESSFENKELEDVFKKLVEAFHLSENLNPNRFVLSVKINDSNIQKLQDELIDKKLAFAMIDCEKKKEL